jgi:hypothetical protein
MAFLSFIKAVFVAQGGGIVLREKRSEVFPAFHSHLSAERLNVFMLQDIAITKLSFGGNRDRYFLPTGKSSTPSADLLDRPRDKNICSLG